MVSLPPSVPILLLLTSYPCRVQYLAARIRSRPIDIVWRMGRRIIADRRNLADVYVCGSECGSGWTQPRQLAVTTPLQNPRLTGACGGKESTLTWSARNTLNQSINQSNHFFLFHGPLLLLFVSLSGPLLSYSHRGRVLLCTWPGYPSILLYSQRVEIVQEISDLRAVRVLWTNPIPSYYIRRAYLSHHRTQCSRTLQLKSDQCPDGPPFIPSIHTIIYIHLHTYIYKCINAKSISVSTRVWPTLTPCFVFSLGKRTGRSGNRTFVWCYNSGYSFIQRYAQRICAPL